MQAVRTITTVLVLLALAGGARAQAAAGDDDGDARNGVVSALRPVSFALPDLQQPQSGDAAKDAQKPATPEHTGFAALLYETGSDFKAFPRRPSTWVILGAGGALALAAHPADHTLNRRLIGSSSAENFWKPGKYLGGSVMATAPIAVYLLGRYVIPPAADTPKTNKWSHVGFDLVRAQIVDEVLVQGLKFSVRRTRPNGSKYSFPSGHSAATFAFAAVLERHLGYRFAWPTVAMAAYVATSRMHDNVHYLSDVVFGAALGTAVGWTVVGRHGRSNYALAPAFVPGGVALTVTRIARHDASASAHSVLR